MSLADDIAWALPELQAEDEARMQDEIIFSVPVDGDPVWDGNDWVPPQATVYSGKCRIRWSNPSPQDSDSGEASWAVDRTVTVRLPVSDPTSALVTDGAVGVVTAVGPRSAALVGMVLTAVTGHWQTDTTARRIPCQVVSRDA